MRGGEGRGVNGVRQVLSQVLADVLVEVLAKVLACTTCSMKFLREGNLTEQKKG